MANYELNVQINGVEQSISTIGGLESALQKTNDQLAQVDKNSQAFQSLQTQAQAIEAELNTITNDASQFNAQLKQVNQTTNTLNSSIQQTADVAQQLGQQTNMNPLNQSINQSINSTDSLRTQLRQTVQELQSLEPGSQRFVELSTRAGQLRDQIADTNTVVGALAGNATERLGTALSGVVNVGITGLQGVVGGMKLFGAESEKAREIMEKLQGLLFVTQAIQGFGALPDSIAAIRAGLSSLTAAREADLVVQEAGVAADTADTATTTINTAAVGTNTTATVAHAAASEADAVATGAATVATEGFTAALAANPIGLIIVGLTALIATLAIFSGGQKTAADNTKETTDEMLAQAAQAKDLEKSILELSIQRRRLEALSITDATKRAAELKKIDDEYLKGQRELLREQERNINQQFSDNIKNFENYAKLVGKVGEKEISAGASPTTGIPVTTTVAVYDQIGKAELEAIRKNANNKKALVDQQYVDELTRLQKSLKSGLITQETYVNLDEQLQASNNLQKQKLEAQYYIDYLTKQKEFLSKSNKANDDTYKKNLENAIKSFAAVRDALVKNLAEQLKIEQDARQKALEEENAAAEEAQRKREAALERARQAYKQAYDDIKSSIKENLKEAQDIEENYLNEIRKLAFTTKEEEILFEQEQEQKKLDAIVKFRIQDVENSKVLGKEKKKLIVQLEEETKQAQDALNQFYFEKRKLSLAEEIKLEEERRRKLEEINTILQKELVFGDQSTADVRESLRQRERAAEISDLDSRAKLNQLNVKEYNDYLREREDLQENYLQNQRILDEQEAQAEIGRRIGNLRELLSKEFGIEEADRQQRYSDARTALDTKLAADIASLDQSLANQIITQQEYDAQRLVLENAKNASLLALNKQYNDEYLKGILTNLNAQKKLLEDNQKSEIDAIDKSKKSTEQKNAEKKAIEEKYATELGTINDKIAAANKKFDTDQLTDASSLYQAKLNGEEEYQVKKLEIEKKYQKESKDNSNKTADEILDNRLKQLENWTKLVTDSLNTVLDLFQAISDLQQVILDNELIDLKLYNEARLNEINTAYNDEVEIQKAKLEQGLITQEQYNAAVTKLDDDRTKNAEKLAEAQRLKELQIKKKSFEDDKKLKTASAIISGIQGAVSAFTGAFTSIPNPIAAAVVGGIMAALVAATTAVQVAAIQKQKFDSSGTAAIVQPVDANAPSTATSAVVQASTGGFTSFNQNVMGPPQNGAGTTTFGSGSQKVYVLESDITAAQDRVRVLESNSTFG